MPLDVLLGDYGWTVEPDPRGLAVVAELPRSAAADVVTRLRKLGFNGHPLEIEVQPGLHRSAVRAARTEDARRRRDTTVGFTRKGARMDREGRVSLTPEALAVSMAAGVDVTVVDAGCGVGGNTIAFARAGARVIAIEQDPGRLDMARHNASLYGVADRVEWIAGDATQLVPTLSADLLFVDPPWGEGYDRGVTRLEDFPFLQSMLQASEPFGRVWLKVPPSFVPLPGFTPTVWFGQAPGDRQRVKFLLLRRGPA